ncbi:MAG: hypothetical protein IKA52_02995 [Bacteroidaceae bacterium]|nr:hypothetical protein [Bacteroidaceae bacterium]
MKRVYITPRCEKVNYELKSFILANSTPQNSPSNRTDAESTKGRRATREWGNLWQ